MARPRTILAIFLTISCIFGINAQQTTSAPSCQSVSSMPNVNATALAGQWYEEFHAPAKNISCVDVDIKAVNNQTQLNVTVMYSGLSVLNQLAMAQINMALINSTNGFNVTYNNSDIVTTFKILKTDYISSAVLCGYTNSSDPSTVFGIIATRTKPRNDTWLMQLRDNASHLLPIFNDGQFLKCGRNSAAAPAPLFAATLYAVFYALVKLYH